MNQNKIQTGSVNFDRVKFLEDVVTKVCLKKESDYITSKRLEIRIDKDLNVYDVDVNDCYKTFSSGNDQDYFLK